MRAVTEETVEVGGAELRTATEGQGRPVVLCHGGPGGTDTLGPAAAMISDIARVHRYDQRACGSSSGGPPYTMIQWDADLEALRRHWGHPRWVVGGHSFGAGLALAYALEHPDRTEAVIWLSCVVRLCGQPDWHDRYRRARLERIPPDRRGRFLRLRHERDLRGPLRPALEAERASIAVRTEFGGPGAAKRWAARLEAELAAANAEANRELGAEFVRYFADQAIRERIRTLEAPVLLVHGDADPRPIAAVEALAGELRHGELVMLPGVGHFPYLEAPGGLGSAMRGFLRSLP